MKGVCGGEIYTALGTSGKGAETKVDQILGCSRVYMGRVFGSLNIHIIQRVQESNRTSWVSWMKGAGIVGRPKCVHSPHTYGAYGNMCVHVFVYYLSVP